jgi:GNAT superfamily N-acetyltransferase
VLEDNGDAVSTVLTARVEDTVSLWRMATPPRFARRGHGRALLRAVLHWAAEDGAAVGLLGATPAGEPLYRTTGWSVIESWNICLNANSAQFG